MGIWSEDWGCFIYHAEKCGIRMGAGWVFKIKGQTKLDLFVLGYRDRKLTLKSVSLCNIVLKCLYIELCWPSINDDFNEHLNNKSFFIYWKMKQFKC